MFRFGAPKVDTNEEKIDELLTRGVSEVIDKEALKKELLSGKQLRIKLGIDPTSPNIHLGRSVQLLKLRDFQNLGHHVVLIVGNATGIIGDTSDKESERPMLSASAVEENAKNYFAQAGKVLDMSRVEKKYNAEWLDALSYKEIGEQADQFSVADFIARENIKKRLDEGKRVSLREVLYPLMQGYDSVAVKADVEIGGTDQRFNLLAGRKLQPFYKQTPQHVLMNELIEGLDGRKMSSSWGNTINLTDIATDMYGKVMSLHDNLIIRYAKLVTRISLAEVAQMEKDLLNGENPKKVKEGLAYEITKMYHGKEEAKKAEEQFRSIFSEGNIPENIESVQLNDSTGTAVEILVRSKIVSSKTEARRLIEEGAVTYVETGEKVGTPHEILHEGVLRVGKKRFIKLQK